MSFVFISYSRADLERVTPLVALLAEHKIDVFWDQTIRFGDDHKTVIVERLDAAGCVLVLWSQHSVDSRWVHYEANAGNERNVLVEARLDSARVPPPFGQLNTANLLNWHGEAGNAEIKRLVQSVVEKTRIVTPTAGEMSVGAPRKNQPVTDAHLALIHTCWRSQKHDADFGGVEMYRWDLAVFGSKQALDRIVEVTYILHPAYENPDFHSQSVYHFSAEAHRKDCFLLKQLANGHSLVRAHIKIEGQHEFVKLSRYINLFDSPARIDDYLC